MIDSTIHSMGRTPLVLAAVFALVLAREGYFAYQTLQEKADAQIAVTESVDRWKSSYLALGATVKQWEKNYQREEAIQDKLALIDELALHQYGFAVDVDAVIVNQIEPIMSNGVPIGLTKVCVGTGLNEEGLEIKAASYGELLAGLKKLASRPDIYIGTIKIKGENQTKPGAVLGDFCLLLRKGNEK